MPHFFVPYRSDGAASDARCTSGSDGSRSESDGALGEAGGAADAASQLAAAQALCRLLAAASKGPPQAAAALKADPDLRTQLRVFFLGQLPAALASGATSRQLSPEGREALAAAGLEGITRLEEAGLIAWSAAGASSGPQSRLLAALGAYSAEVLRCQAAAREGGKSVGFGVGIWAGSWVAGREVLNVCRPSGLDALHVLEISVPLQSRRLRHSASHHLAQLPTQCTDARSIPQPTPKGDGQGSTIY